MVHTYQPSSQMPEAGRLPQEFKVSLGSEFKDSLDYIEPIWKIKKKKYPDKFPSNCLYHKGETWHFRVRGALDVN